MIQINENFSIDADESNWILNDYTPGPSGKKPLRPRTSYFNTLEQALEMIVTRSGKDAGDLQMAIRKIERIRDQIVSAVRDCDLQTMRRAA